MKNLVFLSAYSVLFVVFLYLMQSIFGTSELALIFAPLTALFFAYSIIFFLKETFYNYKKKGHFEDEHLVAIATLEVAVVFFLRFAQAAKLQENLLAYLVVLSLLIIFFSFSFLKNLKEIGKVKDNLRIILFSILICFFI